MPPRKSLPTAAPQAEKAASIAPSTAKASSPLDTAAQPARAVSVPEGADIVAEKGNSHPHGSKRESGINIEDLSLPKSIITRLAKEHLPTGTAVQATAMLGIQKSATVFISYLANQANEYAVQANRKTVNPQDVLKAIEEVGFGEWRAGLEAQLMAFENNAKAKRDKNKGEKTADGEVKEERPRKKLKGHKGEVQEDEEDTTVVEADEAEDKGEQEEEEGDEIEVEDEEDQDEEQEEGGGEEDEEDEELRVSGKSEDEALDNGEDSD